MKLEKYGFIVLAPGYNPSQHNAMLESDEFRTEIICVQSIQQAITAAHKLISKKVQLIELCGGFGEESAKQIIDELQTDVPIGYVAFSKSENHKLVKLMVGGQDA